MTKTQKIKRLEENFKSRDSQFTLICRAENAVLYKRDTGSTICYEVWRLRIRERTTYTPPEYTHYEVTAGNEDFGRNAWFYMSLTKAVNKYDELNDETKTKVPVK